MTIWKFPFAVADSFSLVLPSGARILTIQEQFGMPCMWALCDPTRAMEFRTFRIYGTGHTVGSPGDGYIGTFQQQGGALVWHVFEEIQG